MKQLSDITLLSNVSSAIAGNPVAVRREEDSFTILPVTSGATVGMTLVIEALNPDGTNWHHLATATYNAAGAQPAIQIPQCPLSQIRARVSAWTAGTINVNGYMGAISRG